jgi:hypothetical protein
MQNILTEIDYLSKQKHFWQIVLLICERNFKISSKFNELNLGRLIRTEESPPW